MIVDIECIFDITLRSLLALPMNLIFFLIRASAGFFFLMMAGMSIDPTLPKYDKDWHPNSAATVASLLLATLYFWTLLAEVRIRSVVVRIPTAKSFTWRRVLFFGRWCLAFIVGVMTGSYFFELQFSCGILSLIAVVWLMPPLDRLLFTPNPEMAARLKSSSTFLKISPYLGALSAFLALGFFAQKNYAATNDTLLISIGLLLVVPIILLAKGGWKALSLKPVFSPAAVPHQQFEIPVSRPNVTQRSHIPPAPMKNPSTQQGPSATPINRINVANCILCSRKLHFLNTPLFGSGKLKDGGIVCSQCCNKIAPATFFKLRRYTLSDIKKILQEEAIANEHKKVDKLLQEKLKADKRDEANRVLKERAKVDEQKKVNAVIQQLVSGLLQKATADERISAQLNRSPAAFKNYNIMQMKDVFVCHASEDKRTFIEPLIEELLSENISCWYDNTEIKWGDSIVKKVNQGLSSSRFVLVAISMNSIKKHWPNAELEASINMEFSAGKTKVLPLLIGTDEEIKIIIEHYPILRSKLYVNYSIGIKEIARLLKERIIN